MALKRDRVYKFYLNPHGSYSLSPPPEQKVKDYGGVLGRCDLS